MIFRWTGSCYKIVWKNVAIWIFMYTLISVIYRQVLFKDRESRQLFELVCIYAERYTDWLRPLLAFLIGFYVTQIVSRWWDQFMSLPWPDSLAIKLVNYCPGVVSISFLVT